jgi:hypothetical protein
MSRNNHAKQQLCAHCAKPVRHNDDFIRAHFIGATIPLHWRCFLAQMRESQIAREERKSA